MSNDVILYQASDHGVPVVKNESLDDVVSQAKVGLRVATLKGTQQALQKEKKLPYAMNEDDWYRLAVICAGLSAPEDDDKLLEWFRAVESMNVDSFDNVVVSIKTHYMTNNQYVSGQPAKIYKSWI